MTTEPESRYHPWGTVSPTFWHTPTPPPPRPPHPPKATPPGAEIPPDLLPMVREINRAINRRRLPEAAKLAEAAEAHITSTYGGTHPYTTNIRALRAFITKLDRTDRSPAFSPHKAPPRF